MKTRKGALSSKDCSRLIYKLCSCFYASKEELLYKDAIHVSLNRHEEAHDVLSSLSWADGPYVATMWPKLDKLISYLYEKYE